MTNNCLHALGVLHSSLSPVFTSHFSFPFVHFPFPFGQFQQWWKYIHLNTQTDSPVKRYDWCVFHFFLDWVVIIKNNTNRLNNKYQPLTNQNSGKLNLNKLGTLAHYGRFTKSITFFKIFNCHEKFIVFGNLYLFFFCSSRPQTLEKFTSTLWNNREWVNGHFWFLWSPTSLNISFLSCIPWHSLRMVEQILSPREGRWHGDEKTSLQET